MPALPRLAFAALALLTATAQQEKQEEREPPKKAADCSEIGVHTRSGWYLHILPDGSGSLGFGSSGFDFSRFPAKTFQFEKVFADLRGKATSAEVVRGEGYPVWFRTKAADSAKAFYTKDVDAVARLFETALANAEMRVPRLKKIWESDPPTPKKNAP
jgi:hypothetical protein